MMKKLSTDLADYEFDDQILIVIPKAGLVLEIADMDLMLKEAVAFTNTEKYYAIIDTINHVETTLEARNYYATSEYNKYRYADAFIVKSLPIKMVVNFYMKFNRPIVPTKMFNNGTDAINWFMELRKEEKV